MQIVTSCKHNIGRDFMHLIFILARHKRRFFVTKLVFIYFHQRGLYLVMMEHLAMQKDVSHKESRLCYILAAIYECFWFHAYVSGQMCTRFV